MTRSRLFRFGFILAIVVAVAFGTVTFAGKKPPSGGGGCPKDIVCYDLWDPVQCADGIVYSNQCYADRACAPKPCTSVGGPVEVQ